MGEEYEKAYNEPREDEKQDYEEHAREEVKAEKEARQREREAYETREKAWEGEATEEMKAKRRMEEIKGGEGVMGSLFSIGVSAKEKLGGLVSGSDEDEKKKGKRTDRSGRTLTPLMEQYMNETGKHPRTSRGNLTKDYRRWRARSRYEPTSRRASGGELSGGKIFGRREPTGEPTASKHPLSLRSRPMTQHPLSKRSEGMPKSPVRMGGEKPSGPPKIFDTGGKNESGDTSDTNPFKLQGNEKKPKNPFKS